MELYLGTRRAVLRIVGWRQPKTARASLRRLAALPDSAESKPKGSPESKIRGQFSLAALNLANRGAKRFEIKTTRLGLSERRMRVTAESNRPARSSFDEDGSRFSVSSGHSSTCVRKYPAR